MLFNTVQAIGEIYKIHGSVTDPRGRWCLPRGDYDEYWKKNPYLIAKILTLLVEHPVIFLGYSVSDPHIRQLLANLVSCLTPAAAADTQRPTDLRSSWSRGRASDPPPGFDHDR